MRIIRGRVDKLEKMLQIRDGICQEDLIQVIQGSEEQRKSEVKRRKAELVEEYGPQGLEQIVFIEIIDRYPDNEVASI